MLCSLSTSEPHVAATGSNMALYILDVVFLIQLVMFYYIKTFRSILKNYGQEINQGSFPYSLLLFSWFC